MFNNLQDTKSLYHYKNNQDQFANATILTCAVRILRNYPYTDQELLALLAESEKSFASKLAKLVKSILTPSRASKLSRQLKEDGEVEYGSRSSQIVEICSKFINTKNMKKIVSFTTSHIEDALKANGRSTSSGIVTNIRRFCTMFNLNDHEMQIVTLLFVIKNWKRAEDYFGDHLEVVKPINRHILAVILNMQPETLRATITGRLSKLGIIQDDDHEDLRLTGTFNQFLFDLNEQVILEDFYWKKLNTDSISLKHHLVPEDITNHIMTLLANHDGTTSTNILIYGSPGTGKTTYAKALIHKLKLDAYEIINSNDNSVDTRRAALVACLNMTGGKASSVVLADDADHILCTQDSFSFRGEVSDKSWLNNILEDPNAKVIWIVNNVSLIEESVKRRFAYSYHFKEFNTQQRQAVWMSVLKNHGVKALLKNRTVHDLAQKYKVSTGVIDISVLKAKEVAGKTKSTFLQALTLNLDSHVQLQANGRRSKRSQVAPEYSLEGLNMSGDVETILGQVRACSDRLSKNDPSNNPVVGSNLLIHGVPGGGKSEFAKFLAQTLERELIIKKASELLGMYVGESEKQVAEAFNKAEDREAVLVIDEVDSFLSSRALASRNHEVTLVNEFLTQMEEFRGVLVCTTNNLKMLDPACIRRFVHKVEFKYLTPSGCLSFYDKILGQLSSTPLTTEEMALVSKITNLTPGDFRVVRDQYYYSDNVTNRTMINALIQEAKTKTVLMGVLPIGFGNQLR